ncbi:ceramidase domain-containing protein [Ensifer sp. ENS09]|nr:ceramidase domain-containing protein [Ensifer sp. ENS09]
MNAVGPYCERVGPGFWAEPFNALTNAAFLIAAAAIVIHNRRSVLDDKPLFVLALMTASVGVGSFLFHTLANRWSLIADIVPIAVVIYSFFFLALMRFLRLSALVAGILTVALLVLAPALQVIAKPLLGSSAAYAPG